MGAFVSRNTEKAFDIRKDLIKMMTFNNNSFPKSFTKQDSLSNRSQLSDICVWVPAYRLKYDYVSVKRSDRTRVMMCLNEILIRCYHDGPFFTYV